MALLINERLLVKDAREPKHTNPGDLTADSRMTHINKLKRYLIKCCYWYYVKCDSLISDYEFDMKFKELQALEGDNPSADSPTQMIYGDSELQYPDWAKIR